MRLAYFTHYFPPEGNAPAARVHELSRALVRGGHEVHVVTGQPNYPRGVIHPGYRAGRYTRELVDGIAVHRFPTFPAANRGVVRRSAQFAALPAAQVALGLWRVPPVDCVYATSPQILCGLAGLAFARARRVPFFLEVRDLWPESAVAVGALRAGSPMVRALERVERTLYAAARGIVVVTESFVEHLRGCGVPAERIAVIKNGIDLSMFDPARPPADLRGRLGIPPEALLVLFCGTIGMAHDVGLLARAAARRNGQGGTPPGGGGRRAGLGDPAGRNPGAGDAPDLHFAIVGDGAEREAVEREIRELGVADRVHLLPRVPRAEVPALLAAADVSAVILRDSPTFAGVLPSKMFEAMAMERPILLGVRGEARRLLERAGAGVAFEPGDPDDLLRAARELAAAGPEGRAKLGAAGRSYALRHHDRERLAGKLEGFLEAHRAE